jgi:hypothetical protein
MAQRAIEDRQDLLFYAARRIVSYAVAKAQKRGDLPASSEWYKWEFSTPPKLTIDDGRVMKELESAYKLGFKSAGEITSAMGRKYSDVVRAKAEEAALRKVITKEIEEKYGVSIDAREIAMMTPNDQPDQQDQNNSDHLEDEENSPDESMNEKMRFDNLKAKFDAYGVAVRAGAITPSEVDEQSFRQEAGLPPMTPAVKGAWKEDKGFRRPITLSQKVAAMTGFGQSSNQDPIEE